MKYSVKFWAWSLALLTGGLAALLLLWTAPAQAQRVEIPNRSQSVNIQTFLADLAEAQIVYLGETHDSPADHAAQLEIIRSLHQQNLQLAIGMEMFQQQFQSVIDRYLAGEITEEELREQTEFDSRWGFDWEFYAPILRYARDRQIPVIALNVPTEITRQVAQGGLESLSESDRVQIPPASEIRTDNLQYRQMVQEIYDQFHQGHGVSDGFENFFLAQVLWDETMATNVANFAQSHPNYQVVVLAGQGHLVFGYGIPDRVQRRLGTVEQRSILLNSSPEAQQEPNIADYFWFSESDIESPQPPL
ncbi:ChaN family lipoprotein [Microcoleus sp. FACHB-1515]|uniref:ChaN family lipoprotein n=1 Tax=Cyanophyceae TaxID=3028117 RepID=UPI001689FDC7|nr:ChaN family lipoprotein [Microcoleus sp. FACHB-1515]MBD2088748.1 ChaN family lipoprotein [Microcoleus sp. FACHB-1515]